MVLNLFSNGVLDSAVSCLPQHASHKQFYVEFKQKPNCFSMFILPITQRITSEKKRTGIGTYFCYYKKI